MKFLILFLIGVNCCGHAMEKTSNSLVPSPQIFFQQKYSVSWDLSRKKQKTEKNILNNLIDTTSELAKELKTINQDCKELTNGAQEICMSFVPLIPEIPTESLLKFSRSANQIYNSACMKYRIDMEVINNKFPDDYRLDQEQMSEKFSSYAFSLKKKMLDPYISELKNRGISIDNDSTN